MVCKQLPLIESLSRSRTVLRTDRPSLAQILTSSTLPDTRAEAISCKIQAGWLRCSTFPWKDISAGSVAMDGRERENSQSRRPSIKRPWEEAAISPEMGNSWLGTTLPPIDSAPYHRPSISWQAEIGGNLDNLYQPDNSEVVAKRARYEANNDYTSFPEGKLQSQPSRKLGRKSAMQCLTI
jgi:hypothetical protein